MATRAPPTAPNDPPTTAALSVVFMVSSNCADQLGLAGHLEAARFGIARRSGEDVHAIDEHRRRTEAPIVCRRRRIVGVHFDDRRIQAAPVETLAKQLPH